MALGDMTIANVQFGAEWIEFTFMEPEAVGVLVQEFRTIRVHPSVFDESGELAEVTETIIDMVNRALVVKRDPTQTFTAPR